jgi:hypothetical protein
MCKIIIFHFSAQRLKADVSKTFSAVMTMISACWKKARQRMVLESVNAEAIS